MMNESTIKIRTLSGAPQKRQRHSTSKDEWDKHKKVILDMAATSTYREVRAHLEEKYQFSVTPNELQTRLNLWGYKKNHQRLSNTPHTAPEYCEFIQQDSVTCKPPVVPVDYGCNLSQVRVEITASTTERTEEDLEVACVLSSLSSSEAMHEDGASSMQFSWSKSTSSTEDEEIPSEKCMSWPSGAYDSSQETAEHEQGIPQSPFTFGDASELVTHATTLFEAVKSHNLPLVEAALKSTNVDIRDKSDKTALMVAAEFGYEDIAIELTHRGANVNARDVDMQTTLHKICGRSTGMFSWVNLVIGDINIYAQDKTQSTPLHFLASGGRAKGTQLAKLLLENNAAPNITDEKGQTALHRAVLADHQELIALLLKYRANPNLQDHCGETPLHAAVRRAFRRSCAQNERYKKSIALLLRHNANPQIRDREGRTPLYLAVELESCNRQPWLFLDDDCYLHQFFPEWIHQALLPNQGPLLHYHKTYQPLSKSFDDSGKFLKTLKKHILAVEPRDTPSKDAKRWISDQVSQMLLRDENSSDPT